MEEASVRRTILVASLLIGLAIPARAQGAHTECFQRFEVCAVACAILAEKGCLGACLRDSGCAIADGEIPSRSMPSSRLPDDTLPRGALPDNRMPAGGLPASRMP